MENPQIPPKSRRPPVDGDGNVRAPLEGDDPVQDALPLDLDDPIPFALTARARRAVAPESLPELSVVAPFESREAPSSAPDDAAAPQPDEHADTRPLRARALRRAGMALADITTELGADELLVRAWVDEVAPVTSARRRLRAVPGSGGRDAQLAVAAQRTRLAADEARTAGRQEAAERLASDPEFASGLGVLVGIVEVDDHALVLTTRGRDVAAASLRWLRRMLEPDSPPVRVILRMAPQLAADRARHDWAGHLGVEPRAITTTRWHAAPHAEAVEVIIRIGGERVAGRVAGWRETLLDRLAQDATGSDRGSGGGT